MTESEKAKMFWRNRKPEICKCLKMLNHFFKMTVICQSYVSNARSYVSNLPSCVSHMTAVRKEKKYPLPEKKKIPPRTPLIKEKLLSPRKKRIEFIPHTTIARMRVRANNIDRSMLGRLGHTSKGKEKMKEKSAVSGCFSLKNKKNRNFFKRGLDFCENAYIILGKGMTTLKQAAAKTADHTFFDRSSSGRLGSRKTGVSCFTLSSQPSFFRAMTSAGKGYKNPQNKEVTEW